MAAPKPCLGYRSRSAAIHALRAEGLCTIAIATKVGIDPNSVTALESYRKNGRSRQPGEPGRKGARRPIGADGMYSAEREIMRLFDGGYKVESIVAKTGAKKSYVENVISRFNVRESNVSDMKAVQGSESLLQALRRHHPEVCRCPRPPA